MSDTAIMLGALVSTQNNMKRTQYQNRKELEENSLQYEFLVYCHRVRQSKTRAVEEREGKTPPIRLKEQCW